MGFCSFGPPGLPMNRPSLPPSPSAAKRRWERVGVRAPLPVSWSQCVSMLWKTCLPMNPHRGLSWCHPRAPSPPTLSRGEREPRICTQLPAAAQLSEPSNRALANALSTLRNPRCAFSFSPREKAGMRAACDSPRSSVHGLNPCPKFGKCSYPQTPALPALDSCRLLAPPENAT